MRHAVGLLERERTNCAGNAALLVIVDSTGPYWDFALVDGTILLALEHFGMPYRVRDLAAGPLKADELNECAAVVLAQARLAGRLSDADATLIAEAVRGGVGLVNFDGDLRSCRAPLRALFGLGRINPHAYATRLLRVRPSDHYVTGMQEPGEFHEFDRMVTGTMAADCDPDVAVLADVCLDKEALVYIRHLSPNSAFEPRNHPAVFAVQRGAGRAVQFAISPRVWHGPFFGHTRGLDDVFRRAIVWAARKPFVANIVPPLVALSFDDCSGRHDFGYVDVANRHGYVPMPTLFLDTVPERLFGKVRAGLEDGTALYGTHGFSYYDLLTYDFGCGELGADRLRTNFAREAAWWQKVGAEQGTTVRLHWGEYGLGALPYFKKAGRTSFCPALQMGLHKADMCLSDGYWPYGLQNCYYDYLPDDRDFFGFSSFLQRGREDFLTGGTALLRERERNDVEVCAQSAARCIRHGLRAGFFAELVTHEQKFDALSLEEWDRILARTAELTSDLEITHATHDEVACAMKAKDGIRFSTAAVRDGRLSVSLAGRCETPARVSVFRNEDDGVRREYAPVGPFAGATDWEP